MAEYPSQLLEIFAQIGMKLRAAREAQEMTIEDIAARTRINRIFLPPGTSGGPESLDGSAGATEGTSRFKIRGEIRADAEMIAGPGIITGNFPIAHSYLMEGTSCPNKRTP